jgi:hypothetical protein
MTVLPVSRSEGDCFEWFRRRTSIKLPASFTSEFWSRLALQASLSEPAVLHAVIALGNTHRAGVLDHDSGHDCAFSARQANNDQLSLQHYGKAIRLLRPKMVPTEKGALRVALITCIVFMSLDLLRGHIKTAELHLTHGLQLLRTVKPSVPAETKAAGGKTLIRLEPYEDAIDTWIAEAFSRFHLQFALYNGVHGQPCTLLQNPKPSNLAPSHFSNFKQAWLMLEWLINETLHLTALAQSHQPDEHQLKSFKIQQQQTRASLTHWISAYHASQSTIMNEVALSPSIEETYDAHTQRFAAILDVFKTVREMALVVAVAPTFDENEENMAGARGVMARSIMDLGCIQPLYFTALKCRVRSVRVAAIKFILASGHREGIWDARLAGGVAKRVVEVEEGRRFEGDDEEDKDEDVEAKTDLSRIKRITHSELVMSGEPVSTVSLKCKRKVCSVDGGIRGVQELYSGEYSVISRQWDTASTPSPISLSTTPTT